MLPEEDASPESGWRRIGEAVRTELLEIAWLASTIGALSAAGVGLAVLLAGV
jgi:hypothetical protein